MKRTVWLMPTKRSHTTVGEPLGLHNDYDLKQNPHNAIELERYLNAHLVHCVGFGCLLLGSFSSSTFSCLRLMFEPRMIPFKEQSHGSPDPS